MAEQVAERETNEGIDEQGVDSSGAQTDAPDQPSAPEGESTEGDKETNTSLPQSDESDGE